MQTASLDEVKEAVERNDVTIVNVLPEDSHESEHIPNSINIPEERADEGFPQQFDKDDEIIVYCGSDTCPRSERVVEDLTEQGWENVKDYEPGLAGWKNAGLETASS